MDNKLTKEESEVLDVISKKWQKARFRTNALDKEAAVELINFYYELSGLKLPKIVFTGSPAGNQIAANLIGEPKSEQVKWCKKIFSDCDSETICAAIELTGDEKSEFEKSTFFDYHEPYPVLSNSGWLRFYDFFSKIKAVSCEKFTKLAELAEKAGVWEIVPFEDFCFACPCPKPFLKDSAGLFFSDQEASVEWEDGYKMWCLRGIEFSKEIWEKVVSKQFTLEDLGKITNADERACIVSFLSPERLLKFVSAKFVHEGVKGTKLYEVPNFMGRGATQWAMVMKCPSTGREFLEWARPEAGQTRDADLCHSMSFVDKDGKTLSLEDYLTMIES